MRKIVIIRGPQASGKTTLIRTLGLEGHRLSADVMRAAHRGHVLNSRGELIIDQEDAHQIWDIVGQSLERRLQRGEFVIMDATFATNTTYEGIIEQAVAQLRLHARGSAGGHRLPRPQQQRPHGHRAGQPGARSGELGPRHPVDHARHRAGEQPRDAHDDDRLGDREHRYRGEETA